VLLHNFVVVFFPHLRLSISPACWSLPDRKSEAITAVTSFRPCSVRRGFTSDLRNCSGATTSENKVSNILCSRTHHFQDSDSPLACLHALLFASSPPTPNLLTPSDVLHLRPSHTFKLSALSYISPTCLTSSSHSFRSNIDLCKTCTS